MIEHWGHSLPAPQIRKISELQGVLADPRCTSDEPVYYMYRNLAKSREDERWLRKSRLRFDITVMPPKTICGEYAKTKGHHHPDTAAGPGYPEVYEVCAGEAHYLLQNRRVDDVVLIKASPGDKVIIPPGYGHVTINPAPVTLVTANIVSDAFSSDYSCYEERQGAAYYEMEGGAFVKNLHYPDAPVIRHAAPSVVPELSIGPGTALYDLVGRSRALAFLNHPEQFMDMFDLLE